MNAGDARTWSMEGSHALDDVRDRLLEIAGELDRIRTVDVATIVALNFDVNNYRVAQSMGSVALACAALVEGLTFVGRTGPNPHDYVRVEVRHLGVIS